MNTRSGEEGMGRTTDARRQLARVLGVSGLVLLVPLVAMQFNDAVRWDGFDFLAGGVLLVGFGLLYVLLMRTRRHPARRWIVTLGVAAAFVLTWLELAVGLFGSPLSGS